MEKAAMSTTESERPEANHPPASESKNAGRPLHFIEQIVEEDMRTGKYQGRVHTRFPPSRTAICTSATPSRSV
jgi:hypothetical protein